LGRDLSSKYKRSRKYFRWTNKLLTKVHSYPRISKKRRKGIEANLFVGEWTKQLEDVGDEVRVRFRGGEGYVPKRHLGKKRVLEIYFIDVGQGDSVLIQTPDDKRFLIDGGTDRSAHSFLRWKYRLKKYRKVFEAIIMTHGDEDHARGLITILNDENVITKAIYHNGIAKYKKGGFVLYNDVEDLRPKYGQLTKLYKDWIDVVAKARKRAEENNYNFKCVRADQHTRKISIGGRKGVTISFLSPINFGDENSPCLKKFGDVGKTVNGNSVSVLVEYGKAKISLCGDMNEPAEKLFLRHWIDKSLQAHVFKANHHGSQDFTIDFLRKIRPWITIVSSGDFPDYGHPRANLLGSLGHYAPLEIEEPLLFSTEIAATFKKISESKLQKRDPHLYERTLFGMINVRTDGKWLAAGRVFGKTKKKRRKGRSRRSLWKWEAYAFNLANAKPLDNELLYR
jgi:beta-lactamase superfamily II metal-dependent hydrolase